MPIYLAKLISPVAQINVDGPFVNFNAARNARNRANGTAHWSPRSPIRITTLSPQEVTCFEAKS